MVEKKEQMADSSKASGGSSNFAIKSTPLERPSIQEDIDKEASLDEEIFQDGGIDQLTLESNAILVETTAKLVGKTCELLTRMPEMNFDEEEVEQLTKLWSPILPSMSPVTAAIFGTVVIVSGKVAIYVKLRKERKSEDGTEDVQT